MVSGLNASASPHLRSSALAALRWVAALCLALRVCGAGAHPGDAALSHQVTAWLASLGDERASAQLAYGDPARTDFNWFPGRRAGIPLDELSGAQSQALKNIFNTLLSRQGTVKVDAILATEAALAMLTQAPEYRNPEHYYTAVFGEPGSAAWALRFEGHHLSLNLTFSGDEIEAATPLFLGANPETVPSGPDARLRALAPEVDLAFELYRSLSPAQAKTASATSEWFAGFLTSPGARRAEPPPAEGIAWPALNEKQQTLLWQLIGAYVNTITKTYADEYLRLLATEAPHLRFFWRGNAGDEAPFYYRIAGQRLLIEMETQGSRQHVHAIWRDGKADFMAAD